MKPSCPIDQANYLQTGPNAERDDCEPMLRGIIVPVSCVKHADNMLTLINKPEKLQIKAACPQSSNYSKIHFFTIANEHDNTASFSMVTSKKKLQSIMPKCV